MFSKEYICLVAGLREYSLDTDAKGLDLEALLEEIYLEFSPRDAASVKLLYGYYDCENISAAYGKRANFNPLGQLSKEGIQSILEGDKGGESDLLLELPCAVRRVVEAYASNESEAAELVDTTERFDKALFSAYYDACRESKSKFLRAWSEADRNLRNVTAAITARVAERSIADVVVGGGEVVDQLMRSSAADFGLRGELSYIDAVIGAVNDEPNIVEKEHRLDELRWSVVDELTEGEYFSADFVLGYLVKVNIVARWRMLDAERGRELFAKLIDELSGKKLINNN